MRPFVLLMACACLSACATDPFSSSGSELSLSPAGQDAYGVLREASFFSGACVGIACTTPPTVEAFRILIGEPKADAAFKSLMREAPLEGQLFGLVGVYYTDADRFDLYAASYRRSNREVGFAQGCILGREPVREVVAEIADGTLPRSIRGG